MSAKGSATGRNATPRVAIAFAPSMLADINRLAEFNSASFASVVRSLVRIGLDHVAKP